MNHPTFLPVVERVDNAIAYAGAVDGTAKRIKTNPAKACLLVKVSAKAGVNNLLATLKTSRDNTTWITTTCGLDPISADGDYALWLDEPLMEYNKVAYTEDGADCTATVSSFLMADAPLTITEGHRYEEAEQTSDLIFCRTVVSMQVDTEAANTTSYSNAQRVPAKWEAGFMEVVVANRTVGTVTVSLQFSHDSGTSWNNTTISTPAIAANGTTLVKISRPVGEQVRIKNVGSGGPDFDGSVTVNLIVGQRRSTRTQS